jgi:hypothetical protein
VSYKHSNIRPRHVAPEVSASDIAEILLGQVVVEMLIVMEFFPIPLYFLSETLDPAGPSLSRAD